MVQAATFVLLSHNAREHSALPNYVMAQQGFHLTGQLYHTGQVARLRYDRNFCEFSNRVTSRGLAGAAVDLKLR